MSTRHTPGPWTWSDGESEHECCLGVLMGNGRVVAFGLEPCKGGGKPHPIMTSGENARLIAAAPDLLEACKEDWEDLWTFFNFFASGKSQEQWSRVEPMAVLGELYQRLAIIDSRRRAAIAKAEGKA